VGPEKVKGVEVKQGEEELVASVSALDKLWQGREDLDSAVFGPVETENKDNGSGKVEQGNSGGLRHSKEVFGARCYAVPKEVSAVLLKTLDTNFNGHICEKEKFRRVPILYHQNQ